ncbi:hypothetical protein ACF0H5_004160 [Mactra antiquata]
MTEIVRDVVRRFLGWLAAEVAKDIKKYIYDKIKEAVYWIKEKAIKILNGIVNASKNDKKIIANTMEDACKCFQDKVRKGVHGKLEDKNLEKRILSEVEVVTEKVLVAAA